MSGSMKDWQQLSDTLNADAGARQLILRTFAMIAPVGWAVHSTQRLELLQGALLTQ